MPKSMTAEEERKNEDLISGADEITSSKGYLRGDWVAEMSKEVRSLRKNMAYPIGHPKAGQKDEFAPMLENKIKKLSIAIKMLNENPHLELILEAKHGKDKGLLELLQMVERKASEMENDAMFAGYKESMQPLMKGHNLNAMVLKATNRATGGRRDLPAADGSSSSLSAGTRNA